MKQLTLILLLGLMVPFAILAQSPAESEMNPDKEEIPDVMPRFPGCEEMQGTDDDKKYCAEDKMLQFIDGNIIYPANARENGIQGVVIVSFVVDKNGDIVDSKILRNLPEGCGEEALRVINSMPRWIPGKVDNESVRVQFTVPVTYKLIDRVRKRKFKRNKETS